MIGPNAHPINYFEPDTFFNFPQQKKRGARKRPRCLPLLIVPPDKGGTTIETRRPRRKFRQRPSRDTAGEVTPLIFPRLPASARACASPARPPTNTAKAPSFAATSEG